MALESNPSDVIRRRLNGLAWGLLLAWTGGLILAPGDLETSWHVWLVGVGVILLVAGVVLRRLGYRPDPDTWIFGAVGIVAGAGGLAGVPVSAVGLALLLFGLAFIVSIARTSFVRPAGTQPPVSSAGN